MRLEKYGKCSQHFRIPVINCKQMHTALCQMYSLAYQCLAEDGSVYYKLPLQCTLCAIRLLSDPGGKTVASRRQNQVRQPEDTWPVGFVPI
jgi:hypothetical protein